MPFTNRSEALKHLIKEREQGKTIPEIINDGSMQKFWDPNSITIHGETKSLPTFRDVTNLSYKVRDELNKEWTARLKKLRGNNIKKHVKIKSIKHSVARVTKRRAPVKRKNKKNNNNALYLMMENINAIKILTKNGILDAEHAAEKILSMFKD